LWQERQAESPPRSYVAAGRAIEMIFRRRTVGHKARRHSALATLRVAWTRHSGAPFARCVRGVFVPTL